MSNDPDTIPCKMVIGGAILVDAEEYARTGPTVRLFLATAGTIVACRTCPPGPHDVPVPTREPGAPSGDELAALLNANIL